MQIAACSHSLFARSPGSFTRMVIKHHMQMLSVGERRVNSGCGGLVDGITMTAPLTQEEPAGLDGLDGSWLGYVMWQLDPKAASAGNAISCHPGFSQPTHYFAKYIIAFLIRALAFRPLRIAYDSRRVFLPRTSNNPCRRRRNRSGVLSWRSPPDSPKAASRKSTADAALRMTTSGWQPRNDNLRMAA